MRNMKILTKRERPGDTIKRRRKKKTLKAVGEGK